MGASGKAIWTVITDSEAASHGKVPFQVHYACWALRCRNAMTASQERVDDQGLSYSYLSI